MQTRSDKAKAHRVNPTSEGFEVTSGSSGNVYLVEPLSLGGATCTCPRAKFQRTAASDCSHVASVQAFVEAALSLAKARQ